MLKKTLLIGALMAAAQAVQAEPDYYLVSGFVSKHGKDGHTYRENNYGIGVEQRQAGYSNHVGYYRNSVDRDSFYVGRSFRYQLGDSAVSVGVFAGLVTGYRFAVTPFLAPVVEIQVSKRWAVNVVALPPVPSVTPYVVAAQLKYRFK